ncbi:MAG: GspE/PulE family protein [Candidatus Paceibacterota bacterium]
MNTLSLLQEKGVIDADEASDIDAEVKKTGASLEDVLLKRGIDINEVLQAKGSELEIPTKELGSNVVPFEVLNYIPKESAKHYRFVPLGVSDGVLEVGVVDPDNIDALDALNFISSKANMPFKVYLISEADFEKVLDMYKGLSGEVGEALTELESEISFEEKKENPKGGVALAEDKTEEMEVGGGNIDTSKPLGENIKEDAPVTKIVATIVRYAVEAGASDIHVEPMDDKVQVRYRLDGILETRLTLPVKVHRAVTARIKILASLKLDEKRKPQDGRFSASIGKRKVDFRVSTFPTHYGEKTVMRILDREQGMTSVDNVGLSEAHLKEVMKSVKLPYGLILICGPTGSGKSTTLAAMLQEVDRVQKNVISLEDPIEYNIEGMSQSQVRPEIGYTFASGLRSILRQDPDIIMVGEIRDKETAQLAVQAALTGHLVFSTLHTNTAIGAIPRLVDMGVDPYLIAPTLSLVIAQRLVRTLAPETGKAIPVEGSIKAMIKEQLADLPEENRAKFPMGESVYGIEPTKEHPSGTKGRTGVFEVLRMTKEIENIVLADGDENKIYDAARRGGMLMMKEDAIIKSFNKILPFEEINTLGGELLEISGEEDSQEEKQEKEL